MASEIIRPPLQRLQQRESLLRVHGCQLLKQQWATLNVLQVMHGGGLVSQKAQAHKDIHSE